MAGFDLHEFSGPISGHALREPDRSSSSAIDRAEDTRLVIDAWARHATASGGFADVAGAPDERPDAMAHRRR